MTNQLITIVGAGIGGLTTALLLKQNGFSVRVYEAAPEIKPLGAGIVMANNAMQIFNKLGLRQRIEIAGNRIAKMKITDEKLKLLSVMSPAKFEKDYGVANIAIHRADLQRILADEIGFENISLSKKLVAMEEADEFRLHFDDNTAANCDVVIGADGIKSVVRQSFLGNANIRSTGQVCWRGLCNIQLPASEQPHAIEAWGKGRRFGYVQLGENKLYWYAVVNQQLIANQAPLQQLFEDFHPMMLDMIDKTPVDSIHFSEIVDLEPLHTWQRNKVCLLGDAAHATTPNLGQGACQAIEDAYALSLLLRPGGAVESAFQSYETIRRKKAHAVVNKSRLLGQIAHIENGLVRHLRDIMMRLIPSSAGNKQLRWLFDLGYIESAADKFAKR